MNDSTVKTLAEIRDVFCPCIHLEIRPNFNFIFTSISIIMGYHSVFPNFRNLRCNGIFPQVTIKNFNGQDIDHWSISN